MPTDAVIYIHRIMVQSSVYVSAYMFAFLPSVTHDQCMPITYIKE